MTSIGTRLCSPISLCRALGDCRPGHAGAALRQRRMRLYTPEQEERIAVQALVREWTRSKLLDPLQLARLERDLGTDVRRTNTALRITLVLFTVLLAVASVAVRRARAGVEQVSVQEIIVSGAAAILYLGPCGSARAADSHVPLRGRGGLCRPGGRRVCPERVVLDRPAAARLDGGRPAERGRRRPLALRPFWVRVWRDGERRVRGGHSVSAGFVRTRRREAWPRLRSLSCCADRALDAARSGRESPTRGICGSPCGRLGRAVPGPESATDARRACRRPGVLLVHVRADVGAAGRGLVGRDSGKGPRAPGRESRHRDHHAAHAQSRISTGPAIHGTRWSSASR